MVLWCGQSSRWPSGILVSLMEYCPYHIESDPHDQWGIVEVTVCDFQG